MTVSKHYEGTILLLKFSNPPVNSLSVGSGLVDDLHNALEAGIANPDVTAIVLAGAGRCFSAGADISDFDGEPSRLEKLRALQNLAERSDKPVVAAIHGYCFGGGLELAVAAHYRVASAQATFAFPEITLGLLPGGGGTQRTTRITGATAALDLMLKGKPISAKKAKEIGLIDQMLDGDPVNAACKMIASGEMTKVRRARDMAAPDDVEEALATTRPAFESSLAGQKILECVAAVRHPDFSHGLDLEARLFGELMESIQSKALRHAFFGRRTVTRIPGLSRMSVPPVRNVTVIGGGVMGTGIALALLNAGLQTTLVEPKEEAREKARISIAKTIERDVAKGRVTEDAAQQRLNLLTLASALKEACNADLFIEAVFEDMAVKEQVFVELDRLAPPDALLASNTSTLDLDEIAKFTARPQNVVGLHFFSPANIMRLLEVVRGAATSDQTLVRAMDFGRAIGKTGVVAGVCDGFIGNRIFEEYLRQAWFLLEEGALPQQIDSALENFGFAMGPCRVMDLAGQDIGWHIRQRRAIEQPDRPYSRIPDLICELGRFGQKTGAGMYLYQDGRTPEPDPAVEELIVAETRRIGLERREIADEEIVQRCVYAMINEGARILEEGIAFRPVDIDIVYLDGYGFPAERGGPMFYADSVGLRHVLEAIEEYASGRHGWAWEPAPLLVQLVERGGAFEELNKV